MAVDEMLLEWVARTGTPVWRWYSWEVPTVSLGYFQNASDRASHPQSARCSWVRRATGGGAIIHDGEWTYSCVLPLAHPAARRRDRLYHTIHEAFIQSLASVGVVAEMVRCPSGKIALGCAASGGSHHGIERPGLERPGLEQPGIELPGQEEPEGEQPGQMLPYLCFQRRSPGDVVVGRNKVLGSAQRRSARAVLQHGSFLLRRSQVAPELPGVCDLSAVPLDLPALRRDCLQRLGQGLSLAWSRAEWTPQMLQRSTYWMGEQYAQGAWNAHRVRPAGNPVPKAAIP